MNDDPAGTRFSLKRWSRKKLAATRDSTAPALPAAGVAAPAPAQSSPDAANGGATLPAGSGDTPVLPEIDTLTIDSDFSAFLEPKVDEGLRRQALKQLFRDPHFNVMDGLDVYIDDYSKSDPIAPEIARALVQARYIFAPPKTRIGADGSVEDVPRDDERQSPTLASQTASDAISAAPPQASEALPVATLRVPDEAPSPNAAEVAPPPAIAPGRSEPVKQ